MGLSQVKLAVRADMDPATLNRLEQGKGNPNLKTLERVAEALGVEVAEFFPKASSRSSVEPSLFNGPENGRHPSIFLEALEAAADSLISRASESRLNKGRQFGPEDAAFALIDALHETISEEVWETLPNEERIKLIGVSEKLLEVPKQSIERAEDQHLEDEARNRREKIREMTQQISA
jgi:DNA-binding XRE family transcriptional regulator